VSFPLMLHQHADMSDAIQTSMRVVAKNPIAAAEWGLIVAVLLTLGSIPFFLGLTVIMPLLGHATWHLYRKAIESPLTSSAHEPEQIEREQRYAADFPSVLLPPYGRKHRFFDSSD
jgi:uncharacterized membrane protein